MTPIVPSVLLQIISTTRSNIKKKNHPGGTNRSSSYLSEKCGHALKISMEQSPAEPCSRGGVQKKKKKKKIYVHVCNRGHESLLSLINVWGLTSEPPESRRLLSLGKLGRKTKQCGLVWTLTRMVPKMETLIRVETSLWLVICTSKHVKKKIKNAEDKVVGKSLTKSVYLYNTALLLVVTWVKTGLPHLNSAVVHAGEGKVINSDPMSPFTPFVGAVVLDLCQYKGHTFHWAPKWVRGQQQ